MLLLCMMVTSVMAWAVEVGTADELKNALTTGGETSVKLTADISLTETIELNENRTIELDLAGHNITATSCRALWIKRGSVTIKSSENTGKITTIGTIADNSSVIRVGDKDENTFAASLQIAENVSIVTDLCYGVTVFGKNSTESLTVNGTVKTKVSPAISGNGSPGLCKTTITIGEKADISTENDVAIYHPQDGTLTVNGEVTGAGGIEMKGGSLVVGAKAVIEATAAPTHPSPNNNGTSTIGYAIAIVESNGGYAGVSTVNISKDATITGPVSVVKDSDHPDVTEPSFTGDVKMLVKVTTSDDKSFGQYQTLEDAFREAPGNCTITLLDDISLASTIESTNNYTLDLNGKTITSDGHRAFHIKSGDVTIKSTAASPAMGTITVPTITNNDQSVIRVGSSESAAASLIVGENVTVSADECYGITVFGTNSETLTVNGNVNTKIRPAISGNGSAGLKSTIITIEENAQITTTNEVAVYHPQVGTLTVNGTVTGSTGIEMKGGELVVGSTAVITATGTPTHVANNDGTSTRGYSVAIVENNGGYGQGGGVTAVTINDNAKLTGPVAQLLDSSNGSFNPTYSGAAVGGDGKKLAAIGEDKYFTVEDAIKIVPSTGTVKLLGDLTRNTLVLDQEKTYTLDLAGFDLTGDNCSTIQITHGHVTLENSGAAGKKVTVSGTTSEPVILMGADAGDSRNVSLTINANVTVDGGTITSGIKLAGSKTRETLIVKGQVHTDGHNAILGSKDADKGGTSIHIEKDATVQATNAVVIYHPQSGELIVDGKVIGAGTTAGAIEMKGGDLTVREDATITAVGTTTHTANNEAPSSNGYAIALVENSGFTGVGRVNIDKDAVVTGVIACLVDSKNNNVAEPRFTGDVVMVAETNNAAGLGEKYAKLPDAIAACATSGTVKFLDDITITEGFTVGKALTLDMDDYSIVGNQEIGAALSVNADVNVTLKNGGVKSDKDGISISSGTVALQQMTVNTKGVSLAVSKGTVTADQKSSFSSNSNNTVALSGGTLTMNGKVLNTSSTSPAVAGTEPGVLTVAATATVSSATSNAINWASTGNLTINGGKIAGAEAVHTEKGNVTIAGGTFTGTGNAVNIASADCTPSITGGTFYCGADNSYSPITAVSGKEHFVSGTYTYFSKQIDQNLCATGYMVSANPRSNGYYYLINEVVINDGTIWTKPTAPYTVHTVKYVRNSGMGASGTKFGTLCLPFTFPKAQTGMTFYSVNRIDGDVLYLEAITSDNIPAGTPVIFQFTSETTEFTIESTDAEFPAVDALAANNLVGTFTKTELTASTTPKVNDVYYLNSDAFHKASKSLTVPAFRAYIKLADSSVKVFNICIDDDEADAMEPVLQDGDMEAVYDIHGRKQDGLQKGMNIMKMKDGRTIKVMVK